MLEQAILRDQFQELLDKERQAERRYAELAEQTDDPQLREQILQLRRDKQRHAELTERLLEILE